MKNSFDILIDSYLLNNVGIDTHFLSPSLASGLQQHLLQLQATNQLNAAGIGNAEKKDLLQQTRSDKIYWIDKTHHNQYEQEFLALIEQFINYLNETCYTGITGYEFHYAVYEQGNFYKRHKDQFQNDAHRKFSLISYLNTDWAKNDGGQLVLYQQDEIQEIQPESQTAVFFKSDEMEHEVVKANRERMSITGWLKNS
jgi:Rps23 Pro-64 3,4-dihydroxylase Tpa1-like proline 4-hydroxylase